MAAGPSLDAARIFASRMTLRDRRVGPFSCPFSNFYFLVGRWLGGHSLPAAQAGERGRGRPGLRLGPSGFQKRLHFNYCLAEDRPECALGRPR